MALTNIFREPRRELIEQGLGFVVVGGFVGLDLVVTLALCRLVDGTIHVPTSEFVAFMFLSFLTILVAGLLLCAMHLIGEAICGSMARHGYDPRPTNRR